VTLAVANTVDYDSFVSDEHHGQVEDVELTVPVVATVITSATASATASTTKAETVEAAVLLATIAVFYLCSSAFCSGRSGRESVTLRVIVTESAEFMTTVSTSTVAVSTVATSLVAAAAVDSLVSLISSVVTATMTSPTRSTAISVVWGTSGTHGVEMGWGTAGWVWTRSQLNIIPGVRKNSGSFLEPLLRQPREKMLTFLLRIW
jgi:hypothetical protein